jgi:formamidopyrimidine-DNA glycosylase
VPELPEVAAHAERLDSGFGGAVLESFRPLAFTALKTVEPSPDMALGAAVDAVTNRGKHLLLRVGPVTFVVHLMQGGRLRPDEKRSAKARGGLARWVFEDGRALLLTEAGTEKRAGVWVVAGDPDGQQPLDGLGPDADAVSEEQLTTLLADQSKRLHGVLRSQSVVAGLGRRLANEICHRARLSPFANASQLTPEDISALHAAIGESLAESLVAEQARDDMSSSKDRPAAVHHRDGEACPVCGDTVRAVSYVKYTVNYCATCQTGGKVLADNTTSKFLK